MPAEPAEMPDADPPGPGAVRAILLDLDETLIPDDGAVDAAILAAWAAVAQPVPPEGAADLVRGLARGLWRAGPHFAGARHAGISSWEPLWAEFRSPMPGLPELGPWVEGYRHEVWSAALARSGLDVRLAGDLALRFRHERRLRCVSFDGVDAVLRELARGFRLALVTNGVPELQREKASLAGIDRIIDVIVVSGEVGRAKPDPLPCLVALERLDVVASQAVMVGDRLDRDVAAGTAAGMRTVWISAGPSRSGGALRPTATIDSILGLPALLQSWENGPDAAALQLPAT